MQYKYWFNAYMELLAQHNPWSKYFLGMLLGEKYKDYVVDAYSLLVADSSGLFVSSGTSDACIIYAFCFDALNKVYLTTLDTKDGAGGLEFIMQDRKAKGLRPSNIVALKVFVRFDGG